MADENVSRRLAAILAADMVGYSRLMEADEEGTLARQKTYRAELIDPHIAEHHGRIVKTTGDGLLVEFASAVDAVRCAVEVQRAMADREAEVPEDRRIEYRVGINLGDIIVDGDDIFGDGVNVAARLQEIAEPGGICISGTAQDHLKQTVEAGYAYLGERQVKNIEKPVRVYRVLLDPEDAGLVIDAKPKDRRPWIAAAMAAGLLLVIAAGGLALWQPWVKQVAPARPDRMALELPDKPSVAVLPFDNLSGDPKQEFLADGLAEDIITALSKIEEMFVIARNSTFTYKGKPIKVQQVAEELGARFVVEGSVQKAGERVRITVQLVDAATGRHMWAERYDRELKDFFAIQDEITLNVAAALQVELTEGEHARLWRSGTDSVEAWSYFKRADGLYRRYTREDLAEAGKLWAKAAEADPEWSVPWGGLAWVPLTEFSFGWTDDPAGALQQATELAEKALAMDESLPDHYALLSRIHALKGDYDKALALGEQALALNPNHSMNLAIVASNMNRVGEPEKGIGLMKKAMRRSPFYPPWYPVVLIQSYMLLGRYDEMIPLAEKFVTRNSGGVAKNVHTHLIFAYSEMDRIEEAKTQIAELLELDPDFSVARAKASHPSYKDQAFWDRYLGVLRQAGLPE